MPKHPREGRAATFDVLEGLDLAVRVYNYRLAPVVQGNRVHYGFTQCPGWDSQNSRLKVFFYDGDPGAGGALIGIETAWFTDSSSSTLWLVVGIDHLSKAESIRCAPATLRYPAFR
jgi:hypothetical protein